MSHPRSCVMQTLLHWCFMQTRPDDCLMKTQPSGCLMQTRPHCHIMQTRPHCYIMQTRPHCYNIIMQTRPHCYIMQTRTRLFKADDSKAVVDCNSCHWALVCDLWSITADKQWCKCKSWWTFCQSQTRNNFKPVSGLYGNITLWTLLWMFDLLLFILINKSMAMRVY